MICRVSVHVFVDESRRGSTYLLAAVFLDTAELGPIRVLLRGLRMPGERKVHFKSERDAVQKDIAARLAETGLRGHIYHGRGLDEAVRGACLTRLVADALVEGCTRFVLDSRGLEGDRADRRTVARVLQRHDAVDKMAYEHLRSHEDPALWIPDVLAWCHGAGGDWRRRIAPIVRAVTDIGTVDRNGRTVR